MASSGSAMKANEKEELQVCRVLKSLAMCILTTAWIFIHNIIDKVVNLMFGFIYDDSQKKSIPGIKDPIILQSATSLAAAIRSRKLTSVAVVQAFASRIQQVNAVLNAVVDDRVEAALVEAAEVDKLLESGAITEAEAKETKPFLGVPFTTKESTSCKGMSFTMGLVARRGLKGVEDADVVSSLKKAGGILLAVTNIPELNMWCETRCNVFGQTNNPYNTTRTAGGSSGGESSILAACGSPMGIGSDIGGSIRMPAFYCGIFGHKPTGGLTPLKGLAFRTGLESDSMVCVGPMVKYAEDLTPFLKVLVGSKVSQLQLDVKVNLKDVHFMYMEESGDLRASSVTSEMQEALRKVTHHLETISSYPLEELDLAGFKYSYRIWRYWMTKEPGNFARDITNREGEVSLWQELFRMVIGHPRSNHTLPAVLRLLDMKVLPQEKPDWAESVKTVLQDELLEKLGRNGVLLFPSHPFPASYHYTSFLRPFNFGYWAIFNVLKLPVTQVPLGLSKDGLPLGVQVVAGPYQDHLCVAVARELEKEFGGWVPPCPVRNS